MRQKFRLRRLDSGLIYSVSVAPTCVFSPRWTDPRLVSDWPQLFRADTIHQLPKTEEDIDGIIKIDMVKKMFLEKNEEVFMIHRKFNYTRSGGTIPSWWMKSLSLRKLESSNEYRSIKPSDLIETILNPVLSMEFDLIHIRQTIKH